MSSDVQPHQMPGFIRGRNRRMLGVVFATILIALVPLLWWGISSVRYATDRAKCARNMQALGQAMMMYANAYRGELPDSLASLREEEDISPAAFICPGSNDRYADGPTARAIRDQLGMRGHVSYIYLGKDLTSTVFGDSELVLMYEPLSNHGGAGMNVLFGNGTVVWVRSTAAQSILTQASSATRPVKPPNHQR